ncbi:MAG: UDP-N-acetylmuramoyl-tripeptide--D-alanyl-D-alanine ligase [Thermoanaerobaculia bacterium]
MEGRVISGDPATVWRGAALDSRRLAGGELFFALPGEHVDGHGFVADALAAGAAGAVVTRPVGVPPEATLIQVDDALAALHRLTRTVRSRMPRQLVGITGSIGKTTTKELLVAMLGCRYRVAATPGNLNNLYGFPLALLGIPEETEWMVAEMGMSTPGELGGVSRLGRPDVAVFTNVRPAHLMNFGSIEAIAAAKAELLEGLAEGGLVVANRDDPLVVDIAERHDGPVIWFSVDAEADYRAIAVRAEPDGASTRFRLRAGDEEIDVRLALHGLYNVENFLAAAACAHRLGIDLDEIAAAAVAARPAAMRGVLHELSGGARLIDDSYNSSPAALSRALESAGRIAAERHWAVLGEMLELGEAAPEMHHRAGREAARLGFSPILGVGEMAREMVRGAGEEGAETHWFADAAAAAVTAAERLRAGDLLLVKGSRGVALDTLVDAILEREGAG